jgi:hypothetical protein
MKMPAPIIVPTTTALVIQMPIRPSVETPMPLGLTKGAARQSHASPAPGPSFSRGRKPSDLGPGKKE